MFQVKICGITTIDDARAAVEAGADAIGLNFYPKSPRYVSLDRAKQIATEVGDSLVTVGVMVNPSEAEALATVAEVGLAALQLHGDEPASLAARLSREVAVIKAFRITAEGLRPALDYLDAFRSAGGQMHAALFDAYRPGQFGGIGETADWRALRQYPAQPLHPPLVLAGGLTPDNVAEAIRAVSPAGVDTASGVESSPGRKDAALVARFVRSARDAFAAARAEP